MQQAVNPLKALALQAVRAARGLLGTRQLLLAAIAVSVTMLMTPGAFAQGSATAAVKPTLEAAK